MKLPAIFIILNCIIALQSRVIEGYSVKADICAEAITACNWDKPLYGWCEAGWDHTCCFSEFSPSEGLTQCLEFKKCKYVCCDAPLKPKADGTCSEKVEESNEEEKQNISAEMF